MKKTFLLLSAALCLGRPVCSAADCDLVLARDGNGDSRAEQFKQGAPGYGDLPVLANLKLFEFEMGTGMSVGPAWGDLKMRPGANLFFELRLNRPEPWDFALQMKGAKFSHVAPGGAKIRTTAFLPTLFVDYNHRVSRRTNLFAGVGMGGNFAQSESVVMTTPSTGVWLTGGKNAFAVTPRVGVVVMNGLRLTAEYTFTHRDYSRFGLGVGLVFGGSYKSALRDRRSREQRFWENILPSIINIFLPY